MYKKKYKRRKKNNLFKYFFFSIVLCYLLIKLISVSSSSCNATEIAKYGKIQIIHNLECYVIRNEKLIKSNLEGNTKYFVKEGEKVEKGYKILEIARSNVSEDVKNRLEVVNQKLETLQQNNGELFENDIEKLKGEIYSIIEDIRCSQAKGDLLKVSQLEKELKKKLDKKKVISGDKSFTGKNLDTLKGEQEELTKRINAAVSGICSPISGIISYNVDGYESVFNPKNMSMIELEKMKKLDIKLTDLRGNKTIKNQPLFKIVDDNLWYMVAGLDDKMFDHYKEGQKVTFKFNDEQIGGKVCKIIENKNENMIIFELDEYAPYFYKLRKKNLDVIVVNYEGLKIYKDSIVKRNGKEGVYVLDVNRKACFKPIKVIGCDDEYAVIKNTVFYEEDGDDVKTIPTVKLYDEVVRKATNVKEGQVVY